jgi:hypothetical protein
MNCKGRITAKKLQRSEWKEKWKPYRVFELEIFSQIFPLILDLLADLIVYQLVRIFTFNFIAAFTGIGHWILP